MSTNKGNTINDLLETNGGFPAIHDCMICMEPFYDSIQGSKPNPNITNTMEYDDIRDHTKACEAECLHYYHTRCIDNWFEMGKDYCPVCNENHIPIISTLKPVEFRTEEEYKTIVRTRAQNLQGERLRIRELRIDEYDDMPALVAPNPNWGYMEMFAHGLPTIEDDDNFSPADIVHTTGNPQYVDMQAGNSQWTPTQYDDDDMDSYDTSNFSEPYDSSNLGEDELILSSITGALRIIYLSQTPQIEITEDIYPTIDEQLDTVIETDILNNMILENTRKFQEKYIPDLIELEDLLAVRRTLMSKFCDKIGRLYTEMNCNILANQFYEFNQEHFRITVAMIDMVEINKMSLVELEQEITIHVRGRFDSFPNEMAVEEYDRYHTVLLKRREEIIIRRFALALERQSNMVYFHDSIRYNEMIKNSIPKRYTEMIEHEHIPKRYYYMIENSIPIIEDIPILPILSNKRRKIRNVVKNNSRKNLMRSNRHNNISRIIR